MPALHFGLRSWFRAIVATVPLALAASGKPAAGQEAPKAERGEQIQNASCTTCHDRRPIDRQALDEAGWMKVMASEIEKGAKVENQQTISPRRSAKVFRCRNQTSNDRR